jgi:APA family basic amino acid/polyamine antiporter
MDKPAKLARNLTLFDVYAMSTGAMFSSGLFLLPGIAAMATGNSVFLAYFLAGFLILPAMYCMAELSTAMPKAGGTYYFLDRAMGPLMGTIGGLGSWIAVIFKSAFALVGMGAYLGIYLDLPFKVTAIVLAIAFGAINIFGAKETTQLQRILVITLVVILVGFTLLGLKAAASGPEPLFELNTNYGSFFKSGLVGFVSTIGLVFVSYAGLTKVASVAEEVQNPDRNIPLGMTLSLITATALYTLGTFVLVKIMPAEQLTNSLTPIADAGRIFMGNWPFDIGVILIVVAAIAAFASTGNAGIMSASRYPYAMAKDKLVPDGLAKLGRYKTPTISILLTVGIMVIVIQLFDVQSVAKLASAFQLLLFMLVCGAVIVMRESRISTYKPGFKVPLYPWMPIAGILIGFWLIIEMGILAIGFTGTIVIACVLWYNFYASQRVSRRGAIFHVHERLGRNTYDGLEHELMSIIHDRTQAQNLSYEAVIARSVVTDFRYGKYDLEQVQDMVKDISMDRHSLTDEIATDISTGEFNFRALSEGIRLAIRLDKRLEEPELYIFRFGPKARILFDIDGADALHTMMVLICPPVPAGLDMRIAGHLAEIIGGEGFEQRWLEATSEAELNDVLVRDDHFLHLPIENIPALASQIGVPLAEIVMPQDVSLALVERGGDMLYATPSLVLEAGDTIALIGEPSSLEEMRRQAKKTSPN